MYLATARVGVTEFQENVVTELGDLHRRELVVVQTGRGVEVGRIEALPAPTPAGSHFPHFAKVLRRASDEDLRRQKDLEFDERIKAHQLCAEKILKLKLEMRLVYVELILGGEKAFFYYTSPQRVDFRDLVKELAREIRTRIELRQIGEREAARLLGDYQSCGQKLCCKTFLRKLPPVTMSMARNQFQTLDPGKLAGQCGKLKCCLRYEDSVYQELRKTLPERGSLVITDGAQGDVIGLDVYNQKVTMLGPEGPRVTVDASEIREVRPRKKGENNPPQDRPPDGGNASKGPVDPRQGPRPPRPNGGGRPSPGGRPESGRQARPSGPAPAAAPQAPAPPQNRAAGSEETGLLAHLLQLRSMPEGEIVHPPAAGGSCSTGGCGSGGCGSGGCGCSTKKAARPRPSLEELYRRVLPAFSRA